ncbi:MAG TPA: nitroreductase family protein [Syntrophomonadaceae bacterium]|nr:nitroreductase family protein [Syntrophomonadaceae bacterium]
MDTLECIRTRRSIRRFTEEPVSDEVLNQLFEAIRWAPSWANTQSVEIVVVKNSDTKEKIAELLSTNNPAAKGVLQAPVIIVISAKTGRAGYKSAEQVTDKGDWYMFDAGIASQNLALAAHALGLGSVHVASLNHKALDELLGLPEDVKSLEILPIGYPERTGNPPPRREINEFVHGEKYGSKY